VCLGLDVRAPSWSHPDQFISMDVLSPELARALQTFAPDTIIHCAYVLQPIRDESLMHRINVEGTKNLLKAAAILSPARLLVLSSATAYGAWPDNPVPMDEANPLRARTEFCYAADKTEVERLTAEFAEDQRSVLVTSIRPAIIVGSRTDNYLGRFIFGLPILAALDGVDTPLQFVHEDDTIEAIWTVLEGEGRALTTWPPRTVSRSATSLGRDTVRF